MVNWPTFDILKNPYFIWTKLFIFIIIINIINPIIIPFFVTNIGGSTYKYFLTCDLSKIPCESLKISMWNEKK